MNAIGVVCVCVMLSGCGPTSGDDDDLCVADESNAASTVGCNGSPLGSGVAANEFGGLCTPDQSRPDEFVQGSCRSSDDVCASNAVDLSTGMCLRRCDASSTYVSTGGCPTGSRCFTVNASSDVVFCFPDCTTGSDCTSGQCDSEGGCVPP